MHQSTSEHKEASVDWQRAKEIFADVIEAPHVERAGTLDQAVGADDQLRDVIVRLLTAHDTAINFLSDPQQPSEGSQASVSADTAPASIGAYTLHEVIGEGGFGIVYRATQMEPIKREVAIKLLKRGVDTDRIVQRFQAERDLLGRMSHPGIATVLDAGATEDGRPFVVMELVRGEPITDYSRSRGLDLRARAALVARVARAVHHAHQRAVIHRDLKPSNILVSEVDGQPMPQIIDFGIAKALSGAHERDDTRAGEVLGTPRYMSPEQVEGSVDADTRVDVYSLGVVLCEVLTGAVPRDAESMTARPLREAPAERPSRLVLRRPTDDAQVVSRTAVSRALRGDLDRIILKCVAWGPDHRYDSAAALADDLDRYLRGEPVVAVAPSTAYKARKFVRRHKLAVSLCALAGVSLIAGTMLALVGQRRAEDALDIAEDALAVADAEAARARFVSEFLLDDALIAIDPDVAVAVDRPLTVEQLFREAESRARTQLRGDQQSMFDILGRVGSGYLELRLFADSIRTLQDAVHLGAQLEGAEADVLDLRITLAEAVARRDGPSEDLASVRVEVRNEAVDLLGPTHPVSLRARTAVLDNGVPPTEALVELDDMLAAVETADPELRYNLLKRRGVVLRGMRRYEDEIPTRRQVVALTTELFAPDHSAGMSARFQLGRALMLAEHDEEAAVLFEELLMLPERAIPLDHPGRMSGAALSTNLRLKLGQIDHARRIALYAERLSRTQHGAGSFDHALTAQLIGDTMRANAANTRAVAMIDLAVQTRDDLLRGDSSRVGHLLTLMSQSVHALDEHQAAIELAEAALTRLTSSSSLFFDACETMVQAFRALNQPDEARTFLQATLRRLRAEEADDATTQRLEALLTPDG